MSKDWSRRHCRVEGVFALQDPNYGTIQMNFTRPSGTHQHVELSEVDALALVGRVIDAMVKREQERAAAAEVMANKTKGSRVLPGGIQ